MAMGMSHPQCRSTTRRQAKGRKHIKRQAHRKFRMAVANAMARGEYDVLPSHTKEVYDAAWTIC